MKSKKQDQNESDAPQEAVASDDALFGVAGTTVEIRGQLRETEGDLHHSDLTLSNQDRCAGEMMAYEIGDLYIDHFNESPRDQWAKVMRALRANGFEISFPANARISEIPIPDSILQRKQRAIEALHALACSDGHKQARAAIVEWQDQYIEAGHLKLIQELAESLQSKFTHNENIETLPS